MYLMDVFPVSVVLPSVMGFNDYRSDPGSRTELHDQVIESFLLRLFLQLILLIWGFGQVALALFESAYDMLRGLFGEDIEHV